LNASFNGVQFDHEPGKKGGAVIGVVVRPFPPRSTQWGLFDSLRGDHFVAPSHQGKIFVYEPREDLPVHQSPLEKKSFGNRAYELQISLIPGREHPLVHILSPMWNKLTIPSHRHFNDDSSACALFASDETWRSSQNTLADYVVQVCIWIIKTEYWIATSTEERDGVWLGSEQSHIPSELVKVKPLAPCHCGSGIRLIDCHRTSDIGNAKLLEQIRRGDASGDFVRANFGSNPAAWIASFARTGVISPLGSSRLYTAHNSPFSGCPVPVISNLMRTLPQETIAA